MKRRRCFREEECRGGAFLMLPFSFPGFEIQQVRGVETMLSIITAHTLSPTTGIFKVCMVFFPS